MTSLCVSGSVGLDSSTLCFFTGGSLDITLCFARLSLTHTRSLTTLLLVRHTATDEVSLYFFFFFFFFEKFFGELLSFTMIYVT